MSIAVYWKKVKNNQIVANAGFTLVTQIVNNIFPFLTLKYLVVILGAESFGKISFAQSFIGYFTILVDYGFSTSATQAIAVSRDDPQKARKVFYNVYYAKTILLLISAIALVSIVLSVDRFAINPLLYMAYFGVVIGNMLFPQWYFQGIEKMGYITIVNAVVKIVFLLFVFLFIKKQQDYIFVPLLSATSFILPGLYGFIVAKKKVGKSVAINKKGIMEAFSNGYDMFIPCIMSLFTSGSTVFVLGLMASNATIGYYTGFEKIGRASTLLMVPLTIAMFPTVSRKFAVSEKDGMNYIKKIGIITITTAAIVAAGLIVFSKLITQVLYTPDFLAYRIILYIVAIWVIMTTLSSFIGVQYLTSSGKGRLYSRSFFLTGILSIPIVYLLTYRYSYIGTALSMVINETLLIAFMLLFIKLQKNKTKKL